LAHSDKIALQVAEGMLNASNLSRKQLATRNATTAVAKWVLHVNVFLQLATQRLLRCKLQEKFPWPLVCEIGFSGSCFSAETSNATAGNTSPFAAYL